MQDSIHATPSLQLSIANTSVMNTSWVKLAPAKQVACALTPSSPPPPPHTYQRANSSDNKIPSARLPPRCCWWLRWAYTWAFSQLVAWMHVPCVLQLDEHGMRGVAQSLYCIKRYLWWGRRRRWRGRGRSELSFLCFTPVQRSSSVVQDTEWKRSWSLD